MLRHRATATEVQLRRAEVIRLRFARLSEPDIARRLGVSAATISRDLRAIHDSWSERLQSSFNVSLELGEAVALFNTLESSAVRELVRLQDKGNAKTASVVRCILAARTIREARLNLFVSVGLIPPTLSAANQLPRADDVRRAIWAARAQRRLVPSEAERQWLGKAGSGSGLLDAGAAEASTNGQRG